MEEVIYRLTETGKKNAEQFIRECEAKRKEILDAKLDTADDTLLPTLDVIEEDVNFLGVTEDPEGLCYYNGWGVTDNYDSDYPLLLKVGRDLEPVA